MKDKFIVQVEEDSKTGDLVIPIPTEILNQMGWSEDIELWWEIENDTIILKVKDGTEICTPE